MGGEAIELRADCTRCAALCCVAFAFTSPADFGIAKPAGVPCRHLAGDDRCTIHADLAGHGFRGCAAYDCFGAGQRVTASLGSWRQGADSARTAFAVLPVLRQLHEILWYLADARGRARCAPLYGELDRARRRVDALAGGAVDDLLAADLEAQRAAARPLLRRASDLVRAGSRGRDLSGADLAGRSLRGESLVGADLRGAVLIGTDLRDCDLRSADLIGADLRGADVRGADLTDALFVTRTQLGSARGDSATRRPGGMDRPGHWRH